MKPAKMRFTFLVAAVVVALAWALFYAYFASLPCDPANPNANCGAALKNGELYLFAGLPATLVVTLLVLAWLTGRTPASQNSDS
jgi:hypothetical protein